MPNLTKRLQWVVFIVWVGLLMATAGCSSTGPQEADTQQARPEETAPLPAETPTPTANPTLTPTAIPSNTPMPGAEMNTPLQSDQWRITVLSAVDKGQEFEESVVFSRQSFTLSEPDSHFVRIEVEVETLSDLPIYEAIKVPAIILDSSGTGYSRVAAGVRGGYYDFTKDEEQEIILPVASPIELDYLFIIPDGAEELLFEWPDITPVRLVVEPEEE